MKEGSPVNTFLGLMPFLWFCCFLLILGIGWVELGESPKYGNPKDPYALGLDPLSGAHLLLLLVGLGCVIAWPLQTAITWVPFKERTSLNKASLFLFFIGIAGFLFFRLVLPGQFEWVFD